MAGEEQEEVVETPDPKKMRMADWVGRRVMAKVPLHTRATGLFASETFPKGSEFVVSGHHRGLLTLDSVKTGRYKFKGYVRKVRREDVTIIED